MTSLEVVKLIEAEADEEGDILEELTNQDIKEIYQQLNPQDKKRFRQFRKFHRQYFGVYGEHLPSYHMARQVVERFNARATQRLSRCYCRKASRAPGRRPSEGIMQKAWIQIPREGNEDGGAPRGSGRRSHLPFPECAG